MKKPKKTKEQIKKEKEAENKVYQPKMEKR